MRWVHRKGEFGFPRPGVVMGIVNVTPDSFSDGGQFLDPERAVVHGHRLIAEGAEILDIGGESTRPGASAVSVEEECRRVIPVVQALSTTGIPVSIDTRNPEVARAALAAGATIVNDVAAHREEPAMWEVVAATGAGYVAMHMQGTPDTMQRRPTYADVVGEVLKFLGERLAQLERAGVSRERVVVDPGIGFGKTAEHNFTLLGRIEEFRRLQRPVMLGISRKSFLGSLAGAGVADRLPGGLAGTVWAALHGVSVFRTHDVAATVQALRTAEAISARST